MPADNEFPDTRRTWIQSRLAEGESGLALLHTRLMEIYAEPLQATAVTRLRVAPDVALDLVHGFFASRLSRPDYLLRWQQRGLPLRLWLWKGLCLYRHEWRRQERRLVTAADLPEVEDASSVDPGADLDRAFVASLVRAAQRRAEAQCQAEGFSLHWQVHQRHAAGVALAAVGREFGLSESEARVKLRAPHRRIVAALKELLVEEGVPGAEVPRAIEQLLSSVQ
jgi:hypothetical protein